MSQTGFWEKIEMQEPTYLGRFDPGENPNSNVIGIQSKTDKDGMAFFVLLTTYDMNDPENQNESICRMARSMDFDKDGQPFGYVVMASSIDTFKNNYKMFPWIDEVDDLEAYKNTGVLLRFFSIKGDENKIESWTAISLADKGNWITVSFQPVQ